MQDIEDIWKVNVMGPWILTKDAWKYLSIVIQQELLY